MHGSICSVEDIFFDGDFFAVRFLDGRILAVPIAWFPALETATTEERADYQITPFGIHWSILDEDISVQGLISGRGAQCISSEVNSSVGRLFRNVDHT
jgi:hypothetical protein